MVSVQARFFISSVRADVSPWNRWCFDSCPHLYLFLAHFTLERKRNLGLWYNHVVCRCVLHLNL
jgi:hypothetical protein